MITISEKAAAFSMFPAAMAAEQIIRSGLDNESVGPFGWVLILVFILAGWGARNLHLMMFIWQGAEQRLELGKSVLVSLLAGYGAFVLAKYYAMPDMISQLAAAGGAFLGQDFIFAVWDRVKLAWNAISMTKPPAPPTGGKP